MRNLLQTVLILFVDFKKHSKKTIIGNTHKYRDEWKTFKQGGGGGNAVGINNYDSQ